MMALETQKQAESMNSFTIDIARLTNPTKLYADYLQGGLSDFYRRNFSDPQAALRVASEIDKKKYDLLAVYEILKLANKSLGASTRTLDNIELLRKPSTLCVFGGQQTAFCAGPMYVIYKALTAVKLARRYAEMLGRPVVPCFWMATDDHDFEEVRSANFLLRSGELKKVSYQPREDPSGYAIADIVLDEGVNGFCESVDSALIDTEFKAPLLRAFKQFYKNGNKLSEAFACVFNQFLGEYGIMLVDPNFPGLKEHFKAVFAKEISEHEKTFKLYEQRSRALQEKGYHAQVHKTKQNLNLFIHIPKRKNIILDNEFFQPDGADVKYTSEQLLNLIDKSPDKFSPNVLMRPIAQCYAFPTLAHIVGPSELAYFAQIEPLYDFFDVPDRKSVV